MSLTDAITKQLNATPQEPYTIATTITGVKIIRKNVKYVDTVIRNSFAGKFLKSEKENFRMNNPG